MVQKGIDCVGCVYVVDTGGAYQPREITARSRQKQTKQQRGSSSKKIQKINHHNTKKKGKGKGKRHNQPKQPDVVDDWEDEYDEEQDDEGVEEDVEEEEENQMGVVEYEVEEEVEVDPVEVWPSLPSGQATSANPNKDAPSWVSKKTTDRPPAPVCRNADGKPVANPNGPTAAQIAKREKQIQIGKNTIGYKNYLHHISDPNPTNLDLFDTKYPKTPAANARLSKRAFGCRVKEWRHELHQWDDKGPFTLDSVVKSDPSVVAQTAPSSASSNTSSNFLPSVIPPSVPMPEEEEHYIDAPNDDFGMIGAEEGSDEEDEVMLKKPMSISSSTSMYQQQPPPHSAAPLPRWSNTAPPPGYQQHAQHAQHAQQYSHHAQQSQQQQQQQRMFDQLRQQQQQQQPYNQQYYQPPLPPTNQHPIWGLPSNIDSNSTEAALANLASIVMDVQSDGNGNGNNMWQPPPSQ
jgi:hypothetical protein